MEIALGLAAVFLVLVGIAVWFAMSDPAPIQPGRPAGPGVPRPATDGVPLSERPTEELPPAPRQRTLFDLADAGDLEAVLKLVEENPERLNLRDESGWTVLHHAAYGNHPDLITRLLEQGADVNAAAEGECAPIHMVASDGSPEALKRLLDGGADISLPDDTGSTALHFATLKGRADMIAALLEHGAPVNMKDAEQETALDLARRQKREDAMAALTAAGGLAGDTVSMKDVLAKLPETAAARRIVPRTWHLAIDDPRYEASVEAAKASLPSFLERLRNADEPRAAVKFAVRGPGVVEYVWGEVIEAGEPLRIAFLAPPAEVELDSETAEVPLAEVVDWQLELDDVRTAGGYGQRATFEAIREEYGFLPPDIEEELRQLVDL